MLLIKGRSFLVMMVMILGLGFYGCTQDEGELGNPVEPAPSDLPAEPPMNDVQEQNVAYTPQTIHFAFDRAELTSEAQTALNELADWLKANSASVQVEGHCDERGTIEYNLALGARRAESVKDYLVQLGVEESRLTTISYGEEKPVDEGHSEAAWSKNRRAEFTVSGL